MNTREQDFFIINSRALWETSRAGGDDAVRITDKGLSLAYKTLSAYTENLLQEKVTPVSLSVDDCGIVHLLDTAGVLWTFDPATGCVERFQCQLFDDPSSLAVSNTTMYIIHDSLLRCLARVNHQIRWERALSGNLKITATADEGLYVLDLETQKVFITDRDWVLEEIPIADGVLIDPVDIASDRQRNIYILEAARATDPPRITRLTPAGEALKTLPVSYKEDRTPSAFAVDACAHAIFMAFEEEPGITQFLQYRQFQAQGDYRSTAFDSTIPGCQWHKIVLDAEIPLNTQIEVFFYASDAEDLPPIPAWRGPLQNPRDALLLNAAGQRLWLKLTLSADDAGLNAPLLKQFQVWFPRISYLRYLPAVYQEDALSREFLERFLALFETFMADTEKSILHTPVYLDPQGTPDAFVPWLASWLAIATDENWPLEKTRRLIAHAPELYKQRGTRAGLLHIIELYYGERPMIVEHFQLTCDERPEIPETMQRLFGDNPYTFCVLLPPRTEPHIAGRHCATIVSDTVRNTVRRIIDAEKPAHTHGGLHVLQPWIQLNIHTYLGVNTMLSKPEFIAGVSCLGRDTVLGGYETSGQIEVRSRLAQDTLLS